MVCGLDRSTSRWNTAGVNAAEERLSHSGGLGRESIGPLNPDLGLVELDRLLLGQLLDERDRLLLLALPTGGYAKNSQVAHAMDVGRSARVW